MKFRIQARLAGLVLAIGSMLQVLPAFAAVANVDGSLSNGSTITITGSGFGSKPAGPPLYFWNFGANTTTQAAVSRSRYTGAMRGALSTAVVAPGSSAAFRNDVGGVTEAFAQTDGIPFNSDRLYVWVKKYYGFNIVSARGSSGLNLKFFRLWDPWTHDILTSYEGSMGADSGRSYPEGTGDSATWYKMPQESGKWLIEEFEYQSSDLNQQNGVFNYTRNGRGAYPRTQRFVNRNSQFPNRYSLLFFDQISNNTMSGGNYIYFDSVYVDDTMQRVVISNESSWQNVVWGSGSEMSREVQIPVTWSDSRITVTVRQGGLGNLQTRYLYVIGADGNPVNTSGYALSGAGNGGGTTSKTPNPPTAVSAQ